MNRDELIAQLRDIHAPPPPVDAVPHSFAAWPLVALAAILAIVGVALLWQRTAWRREAKAALGRIDRERDPHARWTSLEDLAARIAGVRGLRGGLPPDAYRDPAGVDETDIQNLRDHVRALARGRPAG